MIRDNQLGKAILNYERALLLNPGDSDIRHNLRFAQNRTEDRIETAGDLFLTHWFHAVRDLYHSNGWAKPWRDTLYPFTALLGYIPFTAFSGSEKCIFMQVLCWSSCWS